MRILLVSLAGAVVLMTSAAPAFAHHKMGHPEIGYGTKAAKAAKAAGTSNDHCDPASKDTHRPTGADMSADDCGDTLEQTALDAGEKAMREHCDRAAKSTSQTSGGQSGSAGE